MAQNTAAQPEVFSEFLSQTARVRVLLLKMPTTAPPSRLLGVDFLLACIDELTPDQVVWVREKLEIAVAADRASDDLLTVAAAAREAGCCEETVKRAIRAGVLPASRRGKGYAIKASDLVAWRDASNTRSSPPNTVPSRRPRQNGKPSAVSGAWDDLRRKAA